MDIIANKLFLRTYLIFESITYQKAFTGANALIFCEKRENRDEKQG